MSDHQVSSGGFTGIRFNKEISQELLVHENISSEIIVITDDKLRLYLVDYEKIVKTQHEWLTPFGIFLTLIAVHVTTDFKASLGVSASTWEAIFLVGTILSAVWMGVVIYRYFRDRKKMGIETFIQSVKDASLKAGADK